MNSIIPQENTLEIITQDELIKVYRERLRMQGKSANTINTYSLRLTKFFEWLGDKLWFEVLPTDAVDYRDHLVEKPYSVQSVALHMTAARRFYSLMVEGGVMQINPFAEVAAPKRSNSRSHKRDTFTRDEWRALLETTSGDTPADKRDRAILMLAYELALREVEIVRADLTDLKNNAGLRVLWVQSKGDTEKGDWLVLPEGVETVINDWLAVRGDEPGPLFVSLSHRNYGERLTTSALRHMWKRRKTTAGIADPHGAKTFHSLRHTAIDSRARYAVKHGKSPFLLQTFARHKSLDTTMSYIHDIGRLDDPPELWGTNVNAQI